VPIINVWCAAGKGTFGTEELIRRIYQTGLHKVVNNKKIIVPQLSAPGINALNVRKQTGFRVKFGPVRAGDIPTYLKEGCNATEEMRTVRFPFLDRLVLTPMEINPAMKKFPLFALIVLIIFGLQPSGIIFRDAWVQGLSFLQLGLLSILSGAFITPLLLPVVPFRSFAVKGWIVGLCTFLMALYIFDMRVLDSIILLAASSLFFPFASSYIALQFTGSTTYTGLSGVKKELKLSIPVYIAVVGLTTILLIVYKLTQWGIA
jgi:hypothetical protein